MIASIADGILQQDVLQELKWDPSIDATNIGVVVKDGVATLTGYVTSFADKWAAPGVRSVENEIRVEP